MDKPEAAIKDSVKPRWQKELKYNRFLPYYDKLTEEADAHLADIKTGLGRSVLLREITPGLVRWSYELNNYISLNGPRFTKEDHVLFIKLFYEFICTPNVELHPLELCCRILDSLLMYPDLLERSDLELEWYPLYLLYELVVWKKLDEKKLLTIPNDMAQSVESVVGRARTYFSLSATREILNEFRPFLCPGDSNFDKAFTIMALFLPTDLPRGLEQHGYLLWLDEVLYWFMNTVNSDAEARALELLSPIPYSAVFHIDLDVHLPHLFSRVLRSFELSSSGRSTEKLDLDFCAMYITTFLGGENSVQEYITQLFEAVESFVHPSNVGPWQYNILNFLYYLASYVCSRVHAERYHKPSWRNQIPIELKLTDAQIDQFVKSSLPCVLSGMFDTEESDLASECLRYLSHLSPQLVVPEVLNRMFDSLYTLVEPHRLTQSLRSVAGIMLPFIREPMLRHQLIPLMVGLLPALDSNDTEKCLLTMQALTYFFRQVPIADCEEAINVRKDLTKDEMNLSSATAVFESFVNQFMDKMFSLVESFGSSFGVGQSTPLSEEEENFKKCIGISSSSLFGNCSSEIYEVAVERVYHFVSETLFERRAAAEVLGQICSSAVSANPQKSFSRFLHLIINKLKDSITDEMIVDDKANCSNVVWYLCLFSEIVKCDGDIIVSERKAIIEFFNLILPLKPKEVSNLLSEIVMVLLQVLSKLYIRERPDSDRSLLDKPLDEYFPIRHWADPCLLKDTDFRWHITNDAELEFVNEILNIFLFDQLKLLENPENMNRDEILKSIIFISRCIQGAGSVLPWLEGPFVKMVDIRVGLPNYQWVASVVDRKIDINGRNVRNYVYEKLHTLIDFILKSRSSEPKALVEISRIFFFLICDRGATVIDVNVRKAYISMYEKAFANKVIRKKSYNKKLHFEKAMLQHEIRLVQTNAYQFTEVHRQICHDLLTLSVNNYVEVQRVAQTLFSTITGFFLCAHRLYIDDILFYLKSDPSITDDQLKGALYLLLGEENDSKFICLDWECWQKVWPAVIKAEHSSEPSVIELLDAIRTSIIDNVGSFMVKFEFPDKSLEIAKRLWSKSYDNNIYPSSDMPDEAEIIKAKTEEHLCNEDNIKKYYSLIDTLVNLAKDTNLHWRHLDMAHAFLTRLIRMDFRFPTKAVKIFGCLLTHDSLETRNRGILAISSILKMHAQRRIKVVVKYKFREIIDNNNINTEIPLSSDPWPLKWGFRKDNEWLIYEESSLPKTEKAWNECIFVDKTCKGFYCWPSKIKICAPFNKQQKSIRTKEELQLDEIFLYDCFTNQDYVEEFCRLNSVEDDEDAENANEISATNVLFFKGLFRTYGNSLLNHFKPVIENMLTKSEKSEQRFVATFFVGLVCGAKYWPFVKHEELWTWLGPVMRRTLNVVPADTEIFWLTCINLISGDREPRTFFWLVNILVDLSKQPMDTPFNTANRISFLQALFSQQQWRFAEVGRNILPFLEPLLNQPYQNLRYKIGSLLTSIFGSNYLNVTLDSKFLPANLNQFLDEIWDKLSLLRKEVESSCPDDVQVVNSDDRKQIILLFKTLISFFFFYRFNKSICVYETVPISSLRFVPLFCYFENDASDEELKQDCNDELIDGVARCLLNSKNIDQILIVCKQCSEIAWWKARLSFLQFFQVSIFSNLFLYSTPCRKSIVLNLVLSLLKDERLEVRQTASETLSGLLHCNYFPTEDSLLKTFRSWTSSDIIVIRHAGVLGLSAVIKSCPYSVPEYLPSVVVDLCHFKSDTQPIIRGTVEKTVDDFKRTHQDSWREHKDCFTEDQLFIMTKVMISPTYYV